MGKVWGLRGKCARTRRRLATAAGTALLAVVLASCGSGAPVVQSAPASAPAAPSGGSAAPAGGGDPAGLRLPASTDAQAMAASSAPAASGSASADETAELQRRIDRTLTALAETIAQPSRTHMINALLEEGFAEDALEVSISQTPTGLEVDAIAAAVLSAEQCIFGQIRDGEVAVAVLPVLDSGMCFIGDQR